MKNIHSEGFVVEVAAPADVSSGDVVKVGSLVGVAVTDAASGERVAIRVEGVFALTVAGATVGDPIYCTPGGGLSTTANGNVRCGTALGSGLVRLSQA